ncbi:sensor histidine kinase [Enterococcus asini]|uniref:sensor histidine kinase n=1 Tax=Enterococcus asini TaxID=57732 RepID=UPI00241EC394|nr:sensor histidine kinase [Enterococcus asini]
MEQFWKKFNNLSYYKKLRGIFYSLFIIITVILFFLGIILLNNMTEGIYERNQEKLSLITYNIQNNLLDAQRLNENIGQNKTIQESLIASNEDRSKPELVLYQTAIEREMNWLLVNMVNVKNTMIFNNKGELLSGSLYFDEDHSIQRKIQALPKEDTIGRWYFSKDLSSAIYVRNLYGSQYRPMEKIGNLAIYYNMNFLQDLLDSSDIFSSDDFVVLHYGEQLASTNPELLADEQLAEEYSKITTDASSRYSFQEIAGNKYFKLTKKITIGNDQIPITYFLSNNEMIGTVVRIITVYYLVVIFVILGSIFVVNGFIKRLVSPINLLAENMLKFRGKNDFTEITKNLDLRREDEIGLLNQSYNQLVAEIEELIKMEYETKILSQEMEYKFLQSQLSPHFLYNTLNSINWLAIKKGDEEISVMVTSLATLLRSKLDMKKESNTVEEEMEIIRAYITIQKVRFKSRLQFDCDIDEHVGKYLIPKLVIQPLIENSIKYGLEKEGPLWVKLTVAQSEDELIFVVEDDGPGFATTKETKSTGIGLVNIRTRLALLYGEDAQITIESVPYKKTTVRITLLKECTKWKDSDGNN